VKSTEIRLVEEFGSLDGEAQGWKLIGEDTGNPTCHYAWLKSCADVLTGDNKLCILVIGRDQPKAVGPLLVRKDRFNRLECLGVEALQEPTELPHTDADALNLLVNAIAELQRPFCLRRVLADSPAVGALKRAFHGRGFVVTLPMPGCPWIPLNSNWKLSASRQSALRRARRKAEELGDVTFEITAPGAGRLASLLEEVFRVEGAGWKSRNGTSLVRDELRRAFFERYAAFAAEKGILRLCFMRINGRAVATQLAVESGGRFWLLKIGFDETYAKCSPGNLLMFETIQYAIGRGLQSYEFLGKAEPWTEMWTSLIRPCESLWIYPYNLPGAVAFASDALTYGWKKLSQRLSNLDDTPREATQQA
jgi:hypothetical protein